MASTVLTFLVLSQRTGTFQQSEVRIILCGTATSHILVTATFQASADLSLFKPEEMTWLGL